MALAKLIKPDKTPATPLEEDIAHTLVELQSHDEMSEAVKLLYFCGAKVFKQFTNNLFFRSFPLDTKKLLSFTSQLRNFGLITNSTIALLASWRKSSVALKSSSVRSDVSFLSPAGSASLTLSKRGHVIVH